MNTYPTSTMSIKKSESKRVTEKLQDVVAQLLQRPETAYAPGVGGCELAKLVFC